MKQQDLAQQIARLGQVADRAKNRDDALNVSVSSAPPAAEITPSPRYSTTCCIVREAGPLPRGKPRYLACGIQFDTRQSEIKMDATEAVSESARSPASV